MREGSNSHLLVALGLLVIQSASAPAAELTTKGIDRLGRPGTNAVMPLLWPLPRLWVTGATHCGDGSLNTGANRFGKKRTPAYWPERTEMR